MQIIEHPKNDNDTGNWSACGGNPFVVPLCLLASGYTSASTVTFIIILPHFSEANGMKFWWGKAGMAHH